MTRPLTKWAWPTRATSFSVFPGRLAQGGLTPFGRERAEARVYILSLMELAGVRV